MNLFIRNQHFRAGTGQKKRPDSSAMLTILPVWRVADIHGKPPASLPPVPDGPVCWEDEMSAQTGHDPYEIRQLHAFRPGDSLRDIHWKVSARTDELMCKEYDGTEEPLAALLLEMETEEAAVDICRMDIFREIGAALSAGLLQAGIRHIVYWYDSGRQTVAGRQIRQEEDHLLMSAELVRTCPGTRLNEEQTGIIRHLLRGGCRETAVLSLDLSLRLYENGKLLRQFSPEEYPRELAALPDMFV